MAENSDILNTQVGSTTLISSSEPTKSYTYYHAGPLFTLGELSANVRLSAAIRRISKNKYQPILPQDLEQRDTTPHSIRDQDIKALLSCDLALFTYDGSELDSGTVVEYMFAKFADIPSVILRTDFRGAGDQGAKGDPWNLMSSFYPRSVGVVVDGMLGYKAGLATALAEGSQVDVNHRAAEMLNGTTANKIIDAFEQVIQQPPRLPKELRGSLYQWLALMPSFKNGSDKENVTEMLELLQSKESKGLY